MKLLLSLVAALLTVFLIQVASAAPQDQSDAAEETPEQVLNPTPSPEELEAAESDELLVGDNDVEEDEDTPGRFIPTEQISQDLGVSFPVDI